MTLHVCVFRLGRRRCFLLSIILSSLLGVAVCLSNSAVMFLLLRLSQGSMLAGVFVSSYIASEYPAQTCNCCPTHPMVKLPATLFSNWLLLGVWGGKKPSASSYPATHFFVYFREHCGIPALLALMQMSYFFLDNVSLFTFVTGIFVTKSYIK